MPTKTKAQIEAEKKLKEEAEKAAPTAPEKGAKTPESETTETKSPETETKTPESDAQAETPFGLTTDTFFSTKIEEPEEETEAEIVDEKKEETKEDEEVIIKQGPKKLKIRALQPNGEPFTGAYGSLHFDPKGVAEISEADIPSVEKLRNQFKSLDIDQI